MCRREWFDIVGAAGLRAISLGGGYHIGDLFGVDLAANIAIAAHLLEEHGEVKRSASLPHSRYTVGGHMFYGSAGLEATWR